LEFKLRYIMAVWKKALVVVLAVLAVYILFVIGALLWAFELKLKRWPVIVYGAPALAQVGDDIGKIRLLERLERLGYTKSRGQVPGVGEWTQSPTSLEVHFKYCPLEGEGIISGPVDFTIDSNRIRAIHLMRSLQDVERVIIEPEVLGVLPAAGWGPDVCRWTPLNQIPPLLIDAIILTEDRHFFTHSGIDFFSILRALEADIKAWRYLQGGSTITQQLVKMTLLWPQKTLLRKSNEIVIAVAAEQFYSKQTILEAYLNRIYFGHWGQFPIRGVEAAAALLFGKSLRQLDPSECALLAAIIRAPNIISPLRHPERARARRNMVLGLLFKDGKISRDDYERAVAAPVHVRKPCAPPVRAPGFLDRVKDVLVADLTESRPGETDVLTSLDPLFQYDAHKQLNRLGSQAQESYLILCNPQTGQLQALVTPELHEWTGEGGNLETVLPILMLPALMPEESKPPRFTLTSKVFAPGGSSRPMTVREAFRENRPALLQKVLETVDRPKIVAALDELGICTQAGSPNHITLAPITPFEMARIYSVLAAGGSAPPITSEIRVVGGAPRISSPTKKSVSFAPSLIFLVNHLMKGIQPPKERQVRPERLWLRPSVFIERDDQGLWGIAYRRDELLLARIAGAAVTAAQLRAMVLRTLPPPRNDVSPSPPVPEGVIFVNICVESGLRATSTCPDVVLEPFLKGSQPSEWCPLRHDVHPVRSEQR
jgi:penicillin-binding protein 1B